MGWEGIEWAIPAYGFLILFVPVFGFVLFRRRVKYKALTKLRAFLCYTGAVIAPVLIFLIFLFGLVGVEDVIETSIITEGLSKSIMILTGVGLFIWLISTFIFGLILILTTDSRSHKN